MPVLQQAVGALARRAQRGVQAAGGARLRDRIRGGQLFDALTTFHVLLPVSGTGCRVAVAENSLLLLGSGEVYVLPSGAHRARLLVSYGADDGFRPISMGTYRLRWEAETAQLALWGTQDQPVDYDEPPLPC